VAINIISEKGWMMLVTVGKEEYSMSLGKTR